MRSYEVCETPFGKFQIQPDDLIGMTTATGVLWDGAGFLQAIFEQHYIPGTTVIDIGANIGTFSIWAAYSAATRIVSVEAHPKTFLMLQASLALNRFCDARVIPLNVAAYDRVTSLAISIYDPINLGATALVPVMGAGSTESVEWIKAAPLDSYAYLFGSRVSLIKVDCQGCDLKAMRGLRETIRRDRPTIVFEYEEPLAKAHDETFADYMRFLAEIRYDWHPWPTHTNNFLATPKRERRDD